jgi:radical SAM superfamily enzyme YgiQ (UPF0313 family)
MAKCKRSGLRRVIVGVESGSQEMMDRIKKDIKLEQVFESAEKCLRPGVNVIFPLPSAPRRERRRRASLTRRGQAPALSPPGFEIPIFYFRPYPGSVLTDDAVRDGYVLPRTLDDWARFDFIGSAGPWVSPERHRLIERFKFYQRIAWNRTGTWMKPVQTLARWCLKKDAYGLPVEKLVVDWLWPQAEMS